MAEIEVVNSSDAAATFCMLPEVSTEAVSASATRAMASSAIVLSVREAAATIARAPVEAQEVIAAPPWDVREGGVREAIFFTRSARTPSTASAGATPTNAGPF
jgi:hypothetical protein